MILKTGWMITLEWKMRFFLFNLANWHISNKFMESKIHYTSHWKKNATVNLIDLIWCYNREASWVAASKIQLKVLHEAGFFKIQAYCEGMCWNFDDLIRIHSQISLIDWTKFLALKFWIVPNLAVFQPIIWSLKSCDPLYYDMYVLCFCSINCVHETPCSLLLSIIYWGVKMTLP